MLMRLVLMRVVIVATSGIGRVRVLVIVRTGILMMPERHALTGDDRRHPLQRQERHQREREKAESSEHHCLFYVSKLDSRARSVPRTDHRGRLPADFVKHSCCLHLDRWRQSGPYNSRRVKRLLGKVLDDRALGPMVAVAVLSQVLERVHHGLELSHPSL